MILFWITSLKMTKKKLEILSQISENLDNTKNIFIYKIFYHYYNTFLINAYQHMFGKTNK